MQIYLVGGAVRDRLLGLPVRERDYLVVGATPEAMRSRGFRQVGRDFPVFLHPQTHAQYALARSQRDQIAAGMEPRPQAKPEVTLEEDLARRDLTINAMAESEAGELIDPFGGQRDLQQRCLRHVSAAFTEDPVRVLRVARFMARYHTQGFRVAPETVDLMRRMARTGQLDGLVGERVWQELVSALGYANPLPFFTSLRACDALDRVFPELNRLWGVPQPPNWHPEIDCGVHSMMTLQAACALSAAPEVRFAALTHDLGKGTTPAQILPGHHGHEARGARLVESLCARLHAPKRFRQLGVACACYHGLCHRLDELKPSTILKLLSGMDAFRQPVRFAQFLLVCEADYRGRRGFAERPYPQAEKFRRLFEAAQQIDVQTLLATRADAGGGPVAAGDAQPRVSGKTIGEALRRARLRAMREALDPKVAPGYRKTNLTH